MMKLGKKLLAVVMVMVIMVTSVPISESMHVKAENSQEDKAWMDTDILMKNDYIGLCVANDGHFSIGTTGGDPDNTKDDNKRLLYGYSTGSTSCTTFRINETNCIYNSKKTIFNTKQAGNQSEMDYQDINIKQKLCMITNSATGREDVVKIHYTVTNNSEKKQSIGCRIMFDTQLGNNDGAPFRIPGIGAVTTETEFEWDDIPQIWQAFDSLSKPTVIAQGRFYRNDKEKPDKVQFASWSRLNSTKWDYKVQRGSGNGDSAVAAIWNQKALAPGEVREYVTYYGLSELSQDLSAPLTLSVYSESELEEKNGKYIPNPFPVNAYIENIGREAAKEVRVKLELPKGLELAEGEEEITLEDVAVNGVSQASWDVEAVPTNIDKDYKIRVILSYDNGSTKSVSRTIHVPATTKQKIEKEVPKALGYTLFSASAEKDFAMSGWKSYITGDVYSGKNYSYNGSILDITGKVDAVEDIIANGWQIKVDQKNKHTESVAMPDLKEDITKKAGDIKFYEGSKKFTEDTTVLDQSIQAEDNITFAGTRFAGGGYIIAGKDITCGLEQAQTYNNAKVVMCSENGDITLNGSEIYLDGILYAPNGTVSVNANVFDLKGRIIAKNIVLNASQVNIEGQESDTDYIYDKVLEEDTEEETGAYTRTFTLDADFSEGNLRDISQRVDDALVLDRPDSDQIKENADTKEYDLTQNGTGFVLKETLNRNQLLTGNEKAVLTYELQSFVNGSKEADPKAETEYDYVPLAAGRKVVLETTLLHAENINFYNIQPRPDTTIKNEDGSITCQWQYDRLMAGDNFTYQIPLIYKELSQEGKFGVTRDTFFTYYDEEGNAHVTYLPNRYNNVTQSVSEGTWEVICDSENKDTDWSSIVWNGVRPDDSDITVEVAASNKRTGLTQWVPVTNGIALENVKGRFAKVKVTLHAASSGKTPKLEDITVSTKQEMVTSNAVPTFSVQERYETAVGQPVTMLIASEDDANGKKTSYDLQLQQEKNAEFVTVQHKDALEKQITFAKAGTYHMTVSVTDGELTTTKQLQFDVTDIQYAGIGKEPEREKADTQVPVASILAPAVNEQVDGNVEIIGTASDDREIAQYILTYRGYEEETEHLLTRSTEKVVEGRLGELDTTKLADGSYLLTLTVIDGSGNITVASSGFVVKHKKEMDCTPPEVEISNIAWNQSHSHIIVEGTAKDETKLKEYVLTIKDNSGKETILAQDSKTREKEELAQIAVKELETGEYILSLKAVDASGNEAVHTMQMQYTKGNSEEEKESETTQEQPDLGTTEAKEPEITVIPKTELSLMLNCNQASVNDTITGKIKMHNIAANTLTVKAGEDTVQVENSTFNYPVKKAGELIFTAVATDHNGETVTAEASCQIYDLSDKTKPIVEITAPEEETVVTEPTNIKGTVMDEKELQKYYLDYAPKGSSNYTTFAEGNKQINNGVLGKLDTTLMEDGIYTIRLTAQDTGGNKTFVKQTIIVQSGLKMGVMNVGFTDLKEVVAGVGMSVSRTYNSTNKRSGDFGYGWTMGLSGLQLYKTNDLSENWVMTKKGTALSTKYTMAESRRHDIIIRYEDGTSDRFKAVLSPSQQAYVPILTTSMEFTCETNNKRKLEINGDNLAITSQCLGENYLFGDFEDCLFEPENFILTLETGEKVYINVDKGVTKIEDTNGNYVKVTKNGYEHSDGKGVAFTRDSQKRITKVTDTSGNELTYTYDKDGNLSTYTDKAGATVTYTYDDNHNLIQITDPQGIAVARNEYGENGRLTAIVDANGNRTECWYNVNSKQQNVTDALGGVTQYIFDNRGNILFETNALGKTTRYTYDENGNQTSVTDPLGNKTTYEYDNMGNNTKVIYPDGTETTSSYNEENRIVSANRRLYHFHTRIQRQ